MNNENVMLVTSYAPEQSATGRLENGREVIILYIKELERECQSLWKEPCGQYRYSWFHNEEKDSYVLHITWTNNARLGIRFGHQHFPLLAAMVEPKDVILTSQPITKLVQDARDRGDSCLSFPETILTFSQLVFEDPRPYYDGPLN